MNEAKQVSSPASAAHQPAVAAPVEPQGTPDPGRGLETDDYLARISAAVDAVDDGLGDDDAPAEAPEAEEPDDDEEEAGDAPESAADEPDEAGPEEGAAEVEEEESIDNLADEHARALRGLRLLDTPEGVLKQLKPEDAIAWWNTRKAAEAATKRRIEELNAKAERPTAAGEHLGVPTPAQEPQTQADDEAVWAAIDEMYGPEGREVLAMLINPLTSELKQLRQVVHASQAKGVEAQVNAARTQVGERFPGLRDDASWTEVQTTARALAALPKYQTLESEYGEAKALAMLFEDAARANGLTEIKAADRERQRKVAAAQKVGTPTTSQNRTRTPAPRTYDDRLDEAIRLAESGKSPTQIRRLLG